MLKRLLFPFVIAFASIPILLPAQKKIGVPKIANLSHFDTNSGTQNWQIEQDAFSTIYIANNSGLITFNGKEWKNYPVPNHTIIRSVALHDGRAYVGAQGMIGYFQATQTGLAFHDLAHLLPQQHTDFGDVWDIEVLDNTVYFRTAKYLFSYTGAGFDVLLPGENQEFSFMGKTHDGLLVANKAEWFVLQGGALQPLSHATSELATSTLEIGKDSTLITLLTNHALLYHDGELSTFALPSEIRESQIISTSLLRNGHIAVGTVSGGIYIIDKQGHAIQQISTSDGLRHNTVLTSFVDAKGLLWLGLDNGLSILEINSAVRNIYPQTQSPTATYATLLAHNTLYLGSSDGLYASPVEREANDISYASQGFRQLAGTNGQVWNLQWINGHLWMLHHHGGFIVGPTGTIDSKIDIGTWLVKPFRGKYYAGTYNGVYEIDLSTNKNHRLLGNLIEPMRFMEIDSARNTLWTSHPYRGVYRYDLADEHGDAVQYAAAQGLPSDNQNYVFSIGEQIVVGTLDGVYTYSESRDAFERDSLWNDRFGNIPIIYLKEDAHQRVWYISDEKISVWDPRTQMTTHFHELEGNMIGGFYHINPIDTENILVGSYDGVFHINSEMYRAHNGKPHISFNAIRVSYNNQDSLLHNGYHVDEQGAVATGQQQVFRLRPEFSILRFEVASHEFMESLEYSYRLRGKEDWSPWTTASERSFGNLAAGTYILEVKARNKFGEESESLSYAFHVEPYWYVSNLAKAAYAIAIVLLSYFLFLLYKRQLDKQHLNFEKKQREIAYLHDLERKNSERIIIELENEKLENEIAFKNKELASITMNDFKRSRLINKVKENIQTVMGEEKNPDARQQLHRILKDIIEDEKHQNEWEKFAIYFDDVHNNFLKKLKETYPTLTPSDLKVCAYLKINMSSKEIAEVLHISPKGVEIARYRLRKRLELPREVKLNEFLENF